MRLLSSCILLVSLLVPPRAAVGSHIVRPFHVDLSHGVSRMKDLVRDTRVPVTLPPLASPISPTPGMDPQWLSSLQKSWSEEFDWDSRQAYINSFSHYTVELEGLDIHFVHAKSTAPSDSEVIPLILTHGWPGSFLEFLPIVDRLTGANPLESDGARSVSFDVVIPSLPGYAFSSSPPAVWTVNDTARVWNTLMVDVLGYTTGYGVAGTDWGALVNWCLLNDYPHARAAHFNFLAVIPPMLDALTESGVRLSAFERAGVELTARFFTTGAAYFGVHQTRPWTLGLAMADNPMGQLAWIAEKYYEWSDPAFIDHTHIFTTVSLYYLTRTFPTALYIYAQNAGFAAATGDVRLGAVGARELKPFGYAAFPWEGVRHPQGFLRSLGNLTYYKEHMHGGHFAPVEVPDAYADSVVEMMGMGFSPFCVKEDSCCGGSNAGDRHNVGKGTAVTPFTSSGGTAGRAASCAFGQAGVPAVGTEASTSDGFRSTDIGIGDSVDVATTTTTLGVGAYVVLGVQRMMQRVLGRWWT